MSEPKKIFLHSPHQNACILNRAILPARHCQQYLPEVKFINSRELMDDHDADVLVVHGMPLETAPAKYERRMQRGCKVICSLDDDLRNMPVWNPCRKIFKPDQYGALDYCTKNVSGLLLSTQTLADAMPRNQNGTPRVPSWVCPNLIDMKMYPAPQRDPKMALRVLWCGSNTHVGDLEEIVESVTDILAAYHGKVEFIFWGECHPEIRRRHIYRGVTEIDADVLSDYFIRLPMMAPDIWLAPLADNAFAAAKSNLKVLEGMALGACVIASPTLPYGQTIQHGTNGWLARTRAEWTNAISACIENERGRLAMQAAGLQTVAEKYNWDKQECVEPWLRFFRAIS